MPNLRRGGHPSYTAVSFDSGDRTRSYIDSISQGNRHSVLLVHSTTAPVYFVVIISLHNASLILFHMLYDTDYKPLIITIHTLIMVFNLQVLPFRTLLLCCCCLEILCNQQLDCKPNTTFYIRGRTCFLPAYARALRQSIRPYSLS